jgi:S1-C subfamily serine protease
MQMNTIPPSSMRRAASAALLALLVLVLSACGSSGEIAATGGAQASPASDEAPISTAGASPAIYVAETLRPSVVDVRVANSQGQAQGLGSGVIYLSSGVIVTNNHVVTAGGDQAAANIAVTLATGERLDASLVGRDPLSDLAILRVDRDDLPAATFLTDMSQVQVGEYAFALGTPLGLEGSVTMGIVSAINREVPGGGSLGTLDLIQTDAAISPGNSGGALADARARVIGINVAAASPDVETRAQNIGFAIPSDLVVDVVEQILETGKVDYGYLGIQTTTITESLEQDYGLSRSEGVLVVQVEPDSPAAKAGVRQGDIIIQIGDRVVDSEVDLFSYLRGQKPGEQVELVLVRDGEEQTLTVTLGNRPSS